MNIILFLNQKEFNFEQKMMNVDFQTYLTDDIKQLVIISLFVTLFAKIIAYFILDFSLTKCKLIFY